MLKAIVLLGAGAVAGGVAAHWWTDNADVGSASSGSASFLSELGGALGSSRQARTGRSESRLEAFRAAARLDDTAALEAALAVAVEQVPSAARTLEIDALLLRLAELDARRSVRAAQSLSLDAEFVAAVMEVWVRDDAAAALAALAELGTLAPAATLQESALAMLKALGRDRESARRIAAALPFAQRAAFEVAAMGLRAEWDPLGAFRDAQTIADEVVRREAQQSVARAWAEADPASALAQAGSLPRNEQEAFRSAVLNEWARLDPDAVFAYLESADTRGLSASTFLPHLAAMSFDRMYAIAQRRPYSRLDTFQQAAFDALAHADPREMGARVEAMPLGQMRTRTAQAVAASLAREDPHAALAWVESLDPPAQGARQALIRALAAADVAGALTFLAEVDPDGQALLLSDTAFAAAYSDASAGLGTIEATAAQIAERSDPAARRALTSFLGQWTVRDHDAAFAWAVAHAASIDGDAFSAIASRIASWDAQAAVAYIDRVPAAHRAAWIAQAAGPYARYDLTAAMEWVATLRADPAYDVAFGRVTTQLAERDPRAAATLLDEAPPSLDQARITAPRIARSWARQDLPAAADWALRRGDEAQRAAAVSNVAGVWAESDPVAAADWARGVPASSRDVALATVLTRMADAGTIDMQLFSAFTSDDARQEVAGLTAIVAARRGDLPQARALIDEYVRDPELRRRFEQDIERALALPPGSAATLGN